MTDPAGGFRDLGPRLVHLVALVVEDINRACLAILAGDQAAAAAVMADDERIDLLAAAIEQDAFSVAATPEAHDHQLLVHTVKIAGEVERTGDLVSNLARAVLRQPTLELTPHQRGLIDRMRVVNTGLWGVVMRSIQDGDAESAASLHHADDELDLLHDEFVAAVLAAAEDGSLTVEQAIQMAIVARFFERIGDHAVNVGEEVHVVLTGRTAPGTAADRLERARREAAASGEEGTIP